MAGQGKNRESPMPHRTFTPVAHQLPTCAILAARGASSYTLATSRGDLVILPQDLRYGLRAMRKAPGFAAIVVALMALGIGANAAVFAAVNGILLRPLPYRDAAGLVFVRENGQAETSRAMRAGVPISSTGGRRASPSAAWRPSRPISFNVAVEGEVERSQAQIVSHDFARVLGVQPALGRFFAPEDDRPGEGRVTVVSHAFWQRAFGGRADVLARSIALNAQPYTIIGVMPAVVLGARGCRRVDPRVRGIEPGRST